jgi:putative ABC transport system permease protein
MIALAQDFRYAARMLFSHPGLTVVIVMTLALGIGANTAIFSVINGVVLQPLPYEHPERLLRLYTQFPNEGLDKFEFSEPEFLELRDQTRAFELMAAWKTTPMNITGLEQPIRVSGVLASSDMLPALEVRPILGRWHAYEETLPGARRVVLISQGLWESGFAQDDDVLGQSIEIDGRAAEIVGVMPAGFEFPAPDVHLWMPLIMDPGNPHNRATHTLSVLGRLREGISIENARADIARLTGAWEAVHRSGHTIHRQRHPIVAHTLLNDMVGAVRPTMLILLGAVGFVLLIACANVSSLILTRAESRQQEIATRAALGATQRRLLQIFLAESLTLSAAGGALGVLLAIWGMDAIIALNPESIPRAEEIGIDRNVLGFALLISLISGILSGLVPLASTRSANLLSAVKAQGGWTTAAPRHRLFRRGVVVVEIGAAVVLAFEAGLLLRSFWRLQQVRPGFEPQNVLTAQISLPQSRYSSLHKVTTFYKRLQCALEALPGVESASMMTELPLHYSSSNNDMYFEGASQWSGTRPTQVDFTQWVWDGYFETMGVELVRGRFIDNSDAVQGPLVAIVNEAAVQRYWPNEDPIGLRLSPNGTDMYTVVGVVKDGKQQSLNQTAGTEVFFSLAQPTTLPLTRGSVNLVVRAEANPLALAPAIRSVIHSLDPALPVANLRAMAGVVHASVARPRFITQLLIVFASMALILVVVGIYGVVSYSVVRRTREFGLRLAVGAGGGHIFRLVLSEGIVMATAGTVAGLAGAVALNQILGARFHDLLYEINRTDAITFVSVAASTICVAAAACYMPARRATKVDPMVALRCE